MIQFINVLHISTCNLHGEKYAITYYIWLTSKVVNTSKNNLSRICSTCRKHLPVLTSFIAYHLVSNQSNTTEATSSPPVFLVVFMFTLLNLQFSVERFVSHCLFFCLVLFVIVCPSSLYGFQFLLWYLKTVFDSGRFGALKSDSTHRFLRNACTKSGSLRFSQFSGC